MGEALEGPFDVSRHGDVDGSIFVVPINLQTNVSGASPIDCGLVLALKNGDEAIDVLFGSVTDTKIVNDQREHEVRVGVFPEASGMVARDESMGGKVFEEVVICEFAGLWEAVHALLDFAVDVAVVDFVVQFVEVEDPFGEDAYGYADIFGLWEDGFKVEVFEVNGGKAGSRRADGAVEEDLDGANISGFGSFVAKVDDSVSAQSVSDSMDLYLFGSIGTDDSDVGDNFVLGYVMEVDKLEGLGAGWHCGRGSKACAHAADFFVIGVAP